MYLQETDLKDYESRIKVNNMSSALRVILGLSILASFGCDDGGAEDDGGTAGTGGLVAVPGTAGTGNVSTSAGTGSATAGTGSNTGGTDSGTAGSGPLPEGAPLISNDGWVTNETVGIQGAMFAYADPTSKMTLTEDFVLTNACIKGEAAKVDMLSTACATKTFTPPATDCYGEFWGAAIGLNLNQPIDPVSMEGVDPPLAFDAGANSITGFAFEITGAAVPTSLRFKIENATGEFCNTAAKPVKKGPNSFVFADLQASCWKPAATNPTGETAKGNIIKIAWQVVTNDKTSVPFDYCVANVRALN
jgi:hypothetical protein